MTEIMAALILLYAGVGLLWGVAFSWDYCEEKHNLKSNDEFKSRNAKEYLSRIQSHPAKVFLSLMFFWPYILYDTVKKSNED